MSVLLLHVRKETEWAGGALGKQSEEVETTWRARNRQRCGENLAKGRMFFHVRGVGIQDILCPAPEGS